MDDERRENAVEHASVSLLEYVCNKFHCFLTQVSLGASAKERSRPKQKAPTHISLHRFFISPSSNQTMPKPKKLRPTEPMGPPPAGVPSIISQLCNPAHMNSSAI